MAARITTLTASLSPGRSTTADSSLTPTHRPRPWGHHERPAVRCWLVAPPRRNSTLAHTATRPNRPASRPSLLTRRTIYERAGSRCGQWTEVEECRRWPDVVVATELITDQLIFLHIILPFTGTYFAQPAAAATGALAIHLSS